MTDRRRKTTLLRARIDGPAPRWDGHRPRSQRVPVVDAEGRLVGCHGITRDVSERARPQEQLRRLADFDALTELPNRRLQMDRLAQTLAQAERFGRRAAVMFLDLDGFKAINDALGDDVGDALLEVVAKRLGDCVGRVDTVSRAGGDEFVVVLEEIADGDAAAGGADKILAALSEAVAVEGCALRLSASIGIAVFGRETGDIVAALIRAADLAMCAAKADGGNRGHFAASGVGVARPASGGIGDGA